MFDLKSIPGFGSLDMHVHVEVFGRPAGMGSKRAVIIRGKARLLNDNSDRLQNWYGAVAQACGEAMRGKPLLTGPIGVSLRFRFCRPKAHYRTGKNADKLKASAPQHHSQKPDLDKLIRSTCDAMSGIVYQDDSQIVTFSQTRKDWAPGPSHAIISVWSLDTERPYV